MARLKPIAVSGAAAVVAAAAGIAIAVATAGAPRLPSTPVPPVPSHPEVQLMAWSWQKELAFYDPPSPLPAEPPGTLMRIQHLAPNVPVPASAVAWRILYYSTGVGGGETVDSGVLVAPSRRAPPGGWPLITYAHATTGIADFCAPSRYSDLQWITDLRGFLDAGDAVVATDYQGLGGPGVHPYLVGTSEGHAVLDAARAAREMPGLSISNRVVAVGFSQGGQAVLFAGQMARAYAPGLDLLGVVAMSAGVAIPAIVHSLSTSANLNGFFVTIAYAWSHVYPGLPITSLLRPAAMALLGNVYTQCEIGIGNAYAKLPPSEVEQPGLDSNPEWNRALEQNDPGHAPTPAPILLIAGKQDLLIPYRLDEQFAEMVCLREHDRVDLRLYPAANHYTATVVSRSAVLSWVAKRFAGKSGPPGCTGVPAPPGGVVPNV